MTITNTVVSLTYQGNGSTQNFAIPFSFQNTSEIRVYLIDSDDEETLQTLTTHYTLTGGTLTQPTTVSMVTAPSSTETLRIQRSTSLTQETSYIQNGVFPAASHEAALDKLTQIMQELYNQQFPYAATGSFGQVSLGAGDGANTIFTLPVSPTILVLFKNGIHQRPGGVDYTLSGATVTMISAPTADQDLWGFYAI